MIWQRSAGDDPFTSQPPPLEDCSSVGCGDAALAGFAVAHERRLDDEETLRLATACGSANCIADAPGRINGRDVLRFAEQIRVRRIVAYESPQRLSVEAQ